MALNPLEKQESPVMVLVKAASLGAVFLILGAVLYITQNNIAWLIGGIVADGVVMVPAVMKFIRLTKEQNDASR